MSESIILRTGRPTFPQHRFVCVGNQVNSYYSTDGLTWNAMSGLSDTSYRAVAFG